MLSPRSGASGLRVTLGLALSAYGFIAGCDAPTFPPASRVENLRILGLRSEPAVGLPGQPVQLDALWVDVNEPDDNDVISAWFPACVNPDFGALEPCLDDLNALQPEPGAEWPAGFTPVPGDSVDVPLAPEVLAGRDDFGIQFFFFAVCRGSRFEFSPSRHPNVPLLCLDARGEPVPQPDFRVGYRTVVAIPELELGLQSRPLITGFDVGGRSFPATCVDDACLGTRTADCSDAQCPVLLRCSTAGDEDDTGEGCDGTRFRVLVDEASAGTDWLASSEEELLSVEVTARYYTTAGDLFQDFDLLHEREPLGEQQRWDRESQSGVVDTLGEIFLWAVVYDSMGGVSWAGIELRVQ